MKTKLSNLIKQLGDLPVLDVNKVGQGEIHIAVDYKPVKPVLISHLIGIVGDVKVSYKLVDKAYKDGLCNDFEIVDKLKKII